MSHGIVTCYFSRTRELAAFIKSPIFVLHLSNFGILCLKCYIFQLCKKISFIGTLRLKNVKKVLPHCSKSKLLFHHNSRTFFLSVDCPVKTKEEQCCVFPFVYRGKKYDSCTTIGHLLKKPWCSLTSNYDRDRRKRWGICKGQ